MLVNKKVLSQHQNLPLLSKSKKTRKAQLGLKISSNKNRMTV